MPQANTPLNDSLSDDLCLTRINPFRPVLERGVRYSHRNFAFFFTFMQGSGQKLGCLLLTDIDLRAGRGPQRYITLTNTGWK